MSLVWVIVDPCALGRGRVYLPDPDAEPVSLRVARPGDNKLFDREFDRLPCRTKSLSIRNQARFGKTFKGRRTIQYGRTHRSEGSCLEFAKDRV
jgi:hypothetical protein